MLKNNKKKNHENKYERIHTRIREVVSSLVKNSGQIGG